ncbi:site-specific DNA-methyltransferase [Roseateles sp. PN1]|uniref:site-specific DNA-methyltransferase n=1 Tax=Roseateles sp. PN1 TaxID=3137372 RepID=UPI003138ABA9
MIEVRPAADVLDTLRKFQREGRLAKCTILDPWYNKGVGGVSENYKEFIAEMLSTACEVSEHVFLWGFPEILAQFVGMTPSTHSLNAWLTWFYKNNPSVIRGWRSAQNACLHFSSERSTIYPEHFLNRAQLQKRAEGKLRYMPGPPSVIECPLNIGFIGRAEQLGHPAQKPMMVFEPLIRMTTKPGDLVLDPMCGSGTTGTICQVLNRDAVLCDSDGRWIMATEERLKNSVIDQVLKKQLAAKYPDDYLETIG